MDQRPGLFLTEDSRPKTDVKLRAKLSCGTFGVRKESAELTVTVAISAFRNIRWNRDAGSNHLIPQAEKPKWLHQLKDRNREARSTLPNLKFLKVMHLFAYLF